MAVWLYTVTKKTLLRMRRKPAHAPANVLSLDELMPDDEELGRLLEDAAVGPEGNLLAAEQHHLLHQAILRVPAPLRIVLVLHDMEELSTEQIANSPRSAPGGAFGFIGARLSCCARSMSSYLEAIPARTQTSPDPPQAAQRAENGATPAECRDLLGAQLFHIVEHKNDAQGAGTRSIA